MRYAIDAVSQRDEPVRCWIIDDTGLLKLLPPRTSNNRDTDAYAFLGSVYYDSPAMESAEDAVCFTTTMA